MDRLVNHIDKYMNLCHQPTVRFLKYEFNNKLLGGVILLRVTSGVTWTQPIYIYIYIIYMQNMEVNIYVDY